MKNISQFLALVLCLIVSPIFSQNETPCEDITVYVGSNVELKVPFNNIINPKYNWYKREDSIANTPTLVLTNVQEEDSGYYQCKIEDSNNVGIRFCFIISVNGVDSGPLEAEFEIKELIIDEPMTPQMETILENYKFVQKDSCMCEYPIELWETQESIDIEETVKKAKRELEEEDVVYNYFFEFPKPEYCVDDDEYLWNSLPPLSNNNPNPIVIALIDNGFDDGLAELQGDIWQNPYQNYDSLSCVDYVNPSGYNPAYPDTLIAPRRHGSAVASIITTFVPANSAIQLMNIQVKKKTRRASLFDFTCGLRYAIDAEVDIINVSMGYYGKKSRLLEKTMQLAKDRGILIVTSAGNGGPNKNNHWPSNFSKFVEYPNIISVGSTDGRGNLMDFSGKGDIYAAGHNLLCPQPRWVGEGYWPRSGTSFSTPLVTAAAVRVMQETTRFPNEIIDTLLNDFYTQVNVFGRELLVDLIVEDSAAIASYVMVPEALYTEAIREAKDSVLGYGIVETTSSTTFRAGEKIRLGAGFHATNGSYFLATIDNCDYGPANRQMQQKQAPIINNREETPTLSLSIQPNPFEQRTNIQFSLPVASKASLTINNTLGQTVKVLVNEQLEGGTHNITFESGTLSAGLYFAVFRTSDKIISKPLVLFTK